MVRALGAHDEVLQVIEAEFSDVNLHVRGNELSISGPADAVQLTLHLVEESARLAAKDTRITARRWWRSCCACSANRRRSGPPTC